MTLPEFSVEKYTVVELLERLATDGRSPTDPLFIPSLQRDFTWDDSQIEDLFDSLLRELPLGSLLFWKVADQHGENEALYRFIQHYADEAAYPSKEKDDLIVRHSSQRVSGQQRRRVPKQYSLVLDGQQRLTSLLIGLEGTYHRRQRRKWKSNLESYTECRLQLNLLALASRNSEHTDTRYEFRFRGNQPENRTEGGAYWWPVSKVLELDGVDSEIARLEEDVAETQDEADSISECLHALNHAVHERRHVVAECVSGLEDETALTLFVRRNKGGDQLSNADIAFSQMSVYWELNGADPKEMLEEYVADLEKGFSDFGFGFGKGLVIRALLVLSGEAPALRRRVLVRETIVELEDKWEAMRGPKGMEDTDDLWETYRIVTEDLGLGANCVSSYKALLPILYYVRRHREVRGADARVEAQNVLDAVEYWLTAVTSHGLMSEVNSYRLVQDMCEMIDEHYPEFPALSVLDEYQEENLNLTTEIDRNQIENMVASVSSASSPVTHLLLTKLYDDDRISGARVEGVSGQWQVDHIFPRKKLDEDLLSERGLDDETIKRCRERVSSLGNLQLLPDNQSKSDKDPGDWMRGQAQADGESVDDLVDLHQLPWDDVERYDDYADFPDFCDQREDQIVKRLTERLTLRGDLSD